MTTSMEYRQQMVDYCDWAIAHRDRIHYAEVRPIPVGLAPHHLPFITDCSGFATLMAKWSGNPDPNGNDFDGDGYTGTMLKHLPHIPFSETLRGDLTVFGAFPGIHVVVMLIGGRLRPDPPVASHGGPGDPNRYRLSEVQGYFGSDVEVTYLRLRPS